jgi:hypothetical protein
MAAGKRSGGEISSVNDNFFAAVVAEAGWCGAAAAQTAAGRPALRIPRPP